MIYANIRDADDKSGKGYFLEFHGQNSIQETDLWNEVIHTLYDDEFRKEMYFNGAYIAFKSLILNHLAQRGFIPGGDNIFYKKGFFDFLRR